MELREKKISKREHNFQRALFDKCRKGEPFSYDSHLIETMLQTMEPERLTAPQFAEESVRFRQITFKLLCVLLSHLTFNKNCQPSSLKDAEKTLICKAYHVATQNIIGALNNGLIAFKIVDILNQEFKTFRAALDQDELEKAILNPLIMVPLDSYSRPSSQSN